MMKFTFEVETTLDEQISFFDKRYCPKVIVTYDAYYDRDWTFQKAWICEVMELPHADQKGAPKELILEKLHEKDQAHIADIVRKDAEERWEDAEHQYQQSNEQAKEDERKPY